MKFKKFIRGTENYATYHNYVAAPILRRSFELEFEPRCSKLEICVSGFYELYVNGKNITKGKLAPFVNNPDHLVYYDEYELSDCLQKGKNAIAVILGNGFANQDSPRQNNNRAPFRAPLVMSLVLHAENGADHFWLESDEAFKVHSSPILYDMYRFGVIYDAREEIDGFSDAKFDDSLWENARIANPPKGQVRKSTALPIKEQYELKPINIEKQEDFYYFYDNNQKPFEKTYVKEGWCYDFGYCCAGVCRLKIKGYRGQKVTLRHGECPRYGKFNMNSIFTVRKGDDEYFHLFQADTYILKGEEEEIFVPIFTYHGFRYVLVEGISEEQVTPDLLTYIVFNTDVKKISNFKCSDPIINKLYEMTIRSDLSNFYHFPTDCPSREKNGWTGDISVSSHQYLMSFDCSENLRMWLENVRCTQTEEGQIPGVVPTNDWGYTWGNGPVWDSAIVNLPYYIYKYTGRTDIINENFEMIFRYLKYIAGKRDESGLVALGLGDWCQPGKHNQISDSPLIFISSIQMYETSMRCAFLFDVIEKKEEREYAQNLALEFKDAIKTHLIDFDTCTVIGDCQTSQAVALRQGFFEGVQYDKAYRKLLNIIKRDNNTINCGLVGVRNIFHVLFENGDCDLAMEMITKKNAPSYRDMIDRGGTALFECFMPNGDNESVNHHYFGDIIHLFISKMAGLCINPDMDDIYNVLINPICPTGIQSAYAQYTFPNGEQIEVEWKKDGEKTSVVVEMLQSAHGTIKVHDKLISLRVGKNEFVL